MNAYEEFRPDWVSAPGDTIVDILHERGLPVRDFAQQMGQSVEATTDLLEGRTAITLAMARDLARVLGASVEFWMVRDFQYRQDSRRLAAAHQEWVRRFPVSDMVKFGWLTPAPLPSSEATALLEFFNVPSVSAWHEAYDDIQAMVAFRTSPSFDSHPPAVAAWLRQGEIEGDAIACDRWDAEKFAAALPGLRPLTRIKDPNRFLHELQVRCAENGVAVVVVRSPAGCRSSGATRILSPSKALIMLSFRYLTDDHFWFTFFHEAAHLVLHREKDLFLETPDMLKTNQEQEANDFAADILVPPAQRSALLRLQPSTREVIGFAHRVGISPGVVVGQLQYHGKLPHNYLNGLKRRYIWES